MITDDQIAKARSHRMTDLVGRNKVLKKSGSGYMGICDFHEETTPSMSLFRGQDGVWRFHCHGCGASGDPIKYVQLKKGVSFPDAVELLTNEAKSAPPRPIATETYDYEDENGQLLYQVLRYQPKSFRQRMTTPQGWRWCMDGVRRVLYRLPKLLKRTDKTIYYVEGEKDVHTMSSRGLLATTHAGGAGAWRKELLEDLKTPRKIVVVPDMDEPGKQLMRRVFADARVAGHDVGFLLLPRDKYLKDGEPAKDVSEWFERGGTVEELLQEVK
jgi:putative DNA primase/helicase